MSEFDLERMLHVIPGGYIYLKCEPLQVKYISSGLRSKTVTTEDGNTFSFDNYFTTAGNELQRLFLSWVKVSTRLCKVQSWQQICAISPIKELNISNGESSFDKCILEYHSDLDDAGTLTGIVIQLILADAASYAVSDSSMSNVERENEVTTTLSIANIPFDEIKTFIFDTSERLKNCIMSADELSNMYVALREKYERGEPVSDNVTNQLESIYIDTLFRHLHTIKGNAVTYEFNNLTESAHDAETVVSQLKKPSVIRRTDIVKSLKDAISRIATSFDFIITIFEKLYFAGDEEQTIRVPLKKINEVHQICEYLDNEKVSERVRSLIRECRTLSWKTLGTVARKYHRVVYSRSIKLGKHIEFIVENSSELVEPGIFEKLDDSLVQIISNAVVHGIESNDIRYQSKKGPGHIRLSYCREGEFVTVRISDDGQGIRSDLLVEQCLKRNELTPQDVAAMTEEEKVRLIFRPRASTAASVTMFAGRGVGLDVVDNRIKSMGGSVTVESAEGSGTVFSIVIPVSVKE
jgi:chemotaxis protein histidine kinase CheA